MSYNVPKSTSSSQESPQNPIFDHFCGFKTYLETVFRCDISKATLVLVIIHGLLTDCPGQAGNFLVISRLRKRSYLQVCSSQAPCCDIRLAVTVLLTSISMHICLLLYICCSKIAPRHLFAQFSSCITSRNVPIVSMQFPLHPKHAAVADDTMERGILFSGRMSTLQSYYLPGNPNFNQSQRSNLVGPLI